MRLFLGLIFTLILSASALAQNSTLRGQIVDELGAVIPNAEIVLINKDGKERKAKSNYTGEFSIANVPPGLYTLAGSYTGFQPFVQSDLKLPVDGPLTVTMVVAAVNIIEEVSSNNATVSTEPDQNMSATVLGEEFIKNLPDNEDDLRDYLNALAGPGAGGGQGGQGGAQIMVDGFSGGRLPPKEAIMQIRINQNPFSAEFSNPGHSRIEIITKPGLGEWRGGGSYGAHNSALDARNAFATNGRPEFHQNRFSFNFGGPLIKKKLDFFGNIERRNLNGEGLVFARTLEGDYVANVDAPSLNTNVFTRSGYLINSKNTLTISYMYSGNDTINSEFTPRIGGGFGMFFGGGGGGGFGGGGGGTGGGSLTLPERASSSENTDHTIRLAETMIINSRLVNETRFEIERENRTQTANTDGVAINVLDAFNGGGSTCCPTESRQRSIEFQNYLTYTYKKHTLKGGIQFERDSISDLSARNFNGTFTFSTLRPDYALGNARQFTISTGNPLVEYSQYQASWFIQDDFRISQSLTLSYGLRHEFQGNLGDKINFAPRVGIAWSPFKDRKTTIRVGGGVFYNRLNSSLYENTLRYNGVNQKSYIINNPVFDPNNPVPPPLDDQFLDTRNTYVRVLDPDLKAPYSVNFTGSVERQLPYNLVGSISYTYFRGVHQFRSRNINAPYPDPNDPTKSIRPDPTQGNIYNIESSASSKYNGLEFRMDRRFGKVSLFGRYSLSWTNSNSDSSLSTPADNYNLAGEWGRAFTDRRHSFFVGGMVNLPKGIRLSPMINVSSGGPFNITTGLDTNRDTFFNDRPFGVNRNSDLQASLYPDLLASYDPITRARVALNLARFPDGVIAQSPGAFSFNLTASKTFGFFGPRGGQNAQNGPGGPGGGMGGRGGGGRGGGRGGGPGGGGFGGPMMMGGPGGGGESSRLNVTISVTASNLFNRVNYGGYTGTLTSPFFGQSTNAGPARQLDFNLRFSF